MLFPSYIVKSSDGRGSSRQGVLPPVSTTPRHADFKGVTLDDLVVLEQVFSLNVYVYDLQETEAGNIAARIVRRSPYSYQETMNFNLYESTSATSVIWRSTATVSCVRNVTGCGNMLASTYQKKTDITHTELPMT